ncbi:SusC/RagA family TonB-linked outer membrane protein [Seleniivibrio sp.]|uniref:SusC/RagA family TonB-linked outer membrane protein n=1 Tax=Seleniivibrio sp. TaxID=2898801 RepID=UPI0025D26C3B|nr:SusC/RagA family TonB-linked outer membrane protein [Seleniivibrio sp.]MCD8554909.1 SusC/RagA family TonB-linked outer membrane protein [Seleniivibrio sp.]
MSVFSTVSATTTVTAMDNPDEINSEVDQPDQRKEITGKVTDNKNVPIPGVTVAIKGTVTGTITDGGGNFKLVYAGEAKTLLFSFVGMKIQEVSVGNKNYFSIVMEEQTVEVGDVVVVGYGTQKKASITGSIAAIGTEDLLQSPQANISNALVGRMTGLLSVQRSGQPGEDVSTLRIRGIGTFAGEQEPLIMVDGIEADNYNNIDPNEIESISILKDASATAVYGVRGANGVLLITTKRGKVGRPQVSYTAQYAISHFTDVRHSMNAYDYATSFNEAKKYDGYITGGYAPQYSDEAIAHYKAHDDPVFYPDIDWFPYMFDKNAGQTQHNVNISGGTDNVKYFISGGFFDQEGLIKHTDVIEDFDAQMKYKRYNIRSNFDFNVTKRLSVSINLSAQIEQRKGTAAPVERIFEASWAGNPVDHPDLADTGGRYVILDGATTTMTPISWLLSEGYQKNYRDYLNSSFRVDYDLGFITKGLVTHFTYSYNNYNEHDKNYKAQAVTYRAQRLEDQSIVYIPQSNPEPYTFTETISKNRKTYIEVGVNYARKFGYHNLSGLVMYNQSKRHDPTLQYLVPNGYQGIVGRVTYDFKSRYLAEFNLGYNGTENFAPGKRFGFFPAYSLGWIPTEELFFPQNDYLTYMKIRGSYGEVGNDKVGGNRFLYQPAAYSYTDNFYQFGEYGSTQNGYQGSLEGMLGNPDLTWEKAKKWDLGVDLALLKDKVKASFDYFRENRNNILSSRNTDPVIVGATLPVYNLGKMRNTGYEIEASFSDRLGKLDYWVKANYSYAHNKIIYMDEVKILILIKTKPVGDMDNISDL